MGSSSDLNVTESVVQTVTVTKLRDIPHHHLGLELMFFKIFKFYFKYNVPLNVGLELTAPRPRVAGSTD